MSALGSPRLARKRDPWRDILAAATRPADHERMHALAGTAIAAIGAMTTAPGYRAHPQHRIRETRVTEPVRVAIDDVIVASSKDVVRVDEDGAPARYYFPRADVRMDMLERTPSMTRCPFKGAASYFTLDIRGKKLNDALWSYEDPYEEHAALKGRVAFYLEKFPELELRMSA